MPVQFRRDEEPVLPARDIERDEDWQGFAHSVLLGIRSGLLWLALFSGLVPLAMMAMRKALLAANNLLLRDLQDHWSDILMPGVLLAFVGAIFGGLVAWRMGSASSLGGGIANLLGIAFCLALAAVGLISGAVLLGGLLPILWISVGALALAGAGAVWLTNHVLD